MDPKTGGRLQRYQRCCTRQEGCNLGVLFLFFWLALRGESWWQRFWIPHPIRQIPHQQATCGPGQLLRGVVEVKRCAGKHPHPSEQYQIQQSKQQVEEKPGQRGLTGRLQEGHRCHFFQDEETGVGQDEGVSRDVVAVPAEAGPPAAYFGCEFLHGNIHGVRFKARAGHLLYVVERLCADVPVGCCHHQRQHPPAEERHTSVEGEVGEEKEGRQQHQRPAPRQLDKIPAGGRRHEDSWSFYFYSLVQNFPLPSDYFHLWSICLEFLLDEPKYVFWIEVKKVSVPTERFKIFRLYFVWRRPKPEDI